MDRPLGSLTVNAHGFANYQLPITVPPGIGAGNEPTLSLNFSQGATTNGALGAKWCLGGLSTIIVINPTLAIDKISFPANGSTPFRYALDGSELLCTNGQYGQPGSTYKPELDSGKTVSLVQSDGALSFTVTDQFGQRQQYGTTSDSRIQSSEASAVFEWKIKRTYDYHGNYVEYNYTQSPVLIAPDPASTPPDSGIQYISSIIYTSNDSVGYTGRMKVSFAYNSRPDAVVAAIWGRLTCTAHILSRIICTVGSADGTTGLPARSYNLTYTQSPATGDSLLISVAEAGSLGTELNATMFKYSGSDPGSWNLFSQSRDDIVTLGSTPDALSLVPLNMTGRSYADLACIRGDANGVMNLTPFIAQPALNATDSLSPTSISWQSIQGKQANTQLALTAGLGKASLLAADLNRDGRTDLVIPYMQPSGLLSFSVAKSIGKGFADVVDLPTIKEWQDGCRFFAVDIDGDGMLDIVQIQDLPDGRTHKIWTYYNIYDASRSNLPQVVETPAWFDSSNTIDWFPIQLQTTNTTGLVQITDMPDNGNPGSNIISATIFRSSDLPFSRTPFTRGSSMSLTEYFINARPQISVLAVDLNGDGAQDIVVSTCVGALAGDGSWEFTITFQSYLFDGTGNFAQQPLNTHVLNVENQPQDPGTFSVVNLDGSRYPCIVYTYQDQAKNWNAVFGIGSSSGKVSNIYQTTIATAANSSIDGTWNLSPADINGIGRGGFILHSLTADKNIYTACPVYNNNVQSDFLVSTTNPLGLCQTLEYAPMSTPGFYDPGVAWDTYEPLSDNSDVFVLGSSTYLVSKVVSRNDPSINSLAIGSQDVGRVKTYNYKAGSLSRQGRGWRGFLSVTEFDRTNGVQHVSFFDQSFPSAGNMVRQDTFGSRHDALIGRLGSWPPVYANDELQLLQSRSWSYDITQPTNPNEAPVYLVNMKEDTRTTFDDGSSKQRTYGTTYTYFDKSNLKETEHVYEIDETHGKITTELWKKTSHAVPINGVDVLPGSRKVTTVQSNNDPNNFEAGDLEFFTFDYHPIQGTLVKSSRWSTDTEDFSSKNHIFDAFGNEISVTNAAGLTTRTEYDSVYHTFPIKETMTGIGVNHTSFTAFDPRYGTTVLSRSAYGDVMVAVTDEWGRPIQRWQTSTENRQSGHRKAPAQFGLPYCLVADSDLQSMIPGFDCVMSENVSRDSIASAAGARFLCRKKITFNDANGSGTNPGLELVDSEGYIRKLCSQENGLSTVAWQYREYDSQGSMILESYPIAVEDGLDWIPDYRSCKASIFDGMKRPAVCLTPPRQAGDRFTCLESVYSSGGALKSTRLRQASNFQISLADPVIETLHHSLSLYDDKLCITGQTNNSGATTTFAHDAIGNVVAMTDPTGNTETRTYNTSRKIVTINTSAQNPTGTAYSLKKTYDAAGNLSSETNAMGQMATFLYDAKSRILNRTDWDGRCTQYEYDVDGVGVDKLASVSITSPAGPGNSQPELAYAYLYDARGLLASETLKLSGGAAGTFTTTFSYDRQGNITEKIFPDSSKLSYVWNGPCLASATMQSPNGEEWDVTVTYQAYSAAGLPMTWDLSGSGDTMASSSGQITYDSHSYPVGIQLSNVGGGALAGLQLQYDALNHIVSSRDTVEGSTTSFAYSDGRLISSATSAATCVYSYDGSGNMTSKNGLKLSYTTSSSGAQVQASNENGQQYSCSYDAAGRAISRTSFDGEVTTMTYDGYGKMRQYTVGTSGTTTILSDHKEQTVAKLSPDVTAEIHCGKDFDVIVRPDGTKVVGRRLYGVGRLLAAVTTTYPANLGTPIVQLDMYMTDQKGTVTHVFDGAGVLRKKLSYDDFGQLISVGAVVKDPEKSTSDLDYPATYEANPLDSGTGLIDFRGRWYDPVIGRFTTPDVNLDSRYMVKPDGLNLYAFESNDPINNVDPSGHINWNFVTGIIASVAVIAVAVAATALTGGLGAVVAGGLFAAGIAGLTYSIKNRNERNAAAFWKGYGVDVAIGAGVGAVTGGVGEWLAPAESMTGLMGVSGDALTAARQAGQDVDDSGMRWLIGVGGKTLLNAGSSVGQRVADVEAENAALGKHETYSGKDLLLTALQGGGMAFLGSVGKLSINSIPEVQAAKASLRVWGSSVWQDASDGLSAGWDQIFSAGAEDESYGAWGAFAWG